MSITQVGLVPKKSHHSRSIVPKSTVYVSVINCYEKYSSTWIY